MKESVHYSKAPIVEALIDIRIRQPQNLSVDDLANLKKVVDSSYTHTENVFLGEVNFQLRDDQTSEAEAKQKNVGLQFLSLDKNQSFQARVDGFTFTIKAPYTRWDLFRDEAKSIWNEYCFVSKPESVTRIAVRYINQINVPHSSNLNLNEYLQTYPQVAQTLPHHDLMGFFLQLQMPQPDLSSLLVLNQARVAPPTDDISSIMLDIDLFREEEEHPWQVNEAIWSFLEELHSRKNDVFEACITDKTRELIR